MAFTGLLLVLFVLSHMYGNLKVFNGPESFNNYAQFLQEDIGYPLISKGDGIWIIRSVLTLAIVWHLYAALVTWRRGKRGRGKVQYKVKSGVKKRQSYGSALTMRYAGIVLLAFFIFHLLQFTALKIEIGGDYHALTPYDRLIVAFSGNWWLWLIYLVAMIALSLHVHHGVFSALATLGLERRSREKLFMALSGVITLCLFVGFMLPPTAIFLGWVH
ncbi:MAG: succinate dehydrogenase cytochrome b subunit [Actinomycetaceae bacterium]|nr:succinate dehydrogenase cytochrome b subunit [Actinomycetaceae bacterium]